MSLYCTDTHTTDCVSWRMQQDIRFVKWVNPVPPSKIMAFIVVIRISLVEPIFFRGVVTAGGVPDGNTLYNTPMWGCSSRQGSLASAIVLSEPKSLTYMPSRQTYDILGALGRRDGNLSSSPLIARSWLIWEIRRHEEYENRDAGIRHVAQPHFAPLPYSVKRNIFFVPPPNFRLLISAFNKHAVFRVFVDNKKFIGTAPRVNLIKSDEIYCVFVSFSAEMLFYFLFYNAFRRSNRDPS